MFVRALVTATRALGQWFFSDKANIQVDGSFARAADRTL
jgi:hypothetical protein